MSLDCNRGLGVCYSTTGSVEEDGQQLTEALVARVESDFGSVGSEDTTPSCSDAGSEDPLALTLATSSGGLPFSSFALSTSW